MSISTLLEMAAAADPDRDAVSCGGIRWTVGELAAQVDGAASVIASSGARHVAYIGTGGALQPLLIFGSARASIPYTPLNYRLSAEAVDELIARLPDPLVVVDDEYRGIVDTGSRRVMTSTELLAASRAPQEHMPSTDPGPEDVAIVLFTSGTTSAPKAVELTHANLTSYVIGTVEFGAAEPGDAALICVPPYHIAGVNAALSNLYAGRKMVYLKNFSAETWVTLAAAEAVTTATVVPTMLDRIVTALDASPTDLPVLRTLAYGGSRVPLPLVRKALQLLPGVGFVNAYGLTETSSTVAVLTPEDHREAYAADNPSVARRLGSVGRAVPGIELQLRDSAGRVLGSDATGELWVRGDQVSGRYTGLGSVLDDEGWFPTKDLATIDRDGYLFIHGRSDDTIIRGGENIAPAEVEDVLVEHPAVREAVVVGVDDDHWGQAMVAVVVPVPAMSPGPEQLRDFVRQALRGSRTPDRIVFRDELPATPTGKILRREIIADLQADRRVNGQVSRQP